MKEWREIPGYDGYYEISFMGEVRSWRSRWGRTKTATLMTPYKKKPRGKNPRNSNRVYVKLTDNQGNAKEVSVVTLMVAVWKGGCPPGKCPYHINADTLDNRAANIGFITRQELGRLTGANSRRMPVEKVDKHGMPVEVYSSAREAARQNHMSYQTVIDRCHGRVKNPCALDGCTYRYER